MGGPGSGRKPAWLDDRTHCKETTEDYFALDIRAVKRHGLITTGQEGLLGIARIVWRSSGFGAPEGSHLRPWFICPLEDCQRRVAILYSRILDPDGTIPQTKPSEAPRTLAPLWACRTCRDLCYPVELEDQVGRGLKRMTKIRDKIGRTNTKPKGMHHRTFVRLGLAFLKASQETGEASRARWIHSWEQMHKEDIQHEKLLRDLDKRRVKLRNRQPQGGREDQWPQEAAQRSLQ